VGIPSRLSRARLWLWVLSFASFLLSNALIATASTDRYGDTPATVRLPGHVLAVLAKATVVASNPNSGALPVTLTIVLRRDDQAGFERYLDGLRDPHSFKLSSLSHTERDRGSIRSFE
jgi:hypothetical protein